MQVIISFMGFVAILSIQLVLMVLVLLLGLWFHLLELFQWLITKSIFWWLMGLLLGMITILHQTHSHNYPRIQQQLFMDQIRSIM